MIENEKDQDGRDGGKEDGGFQVVTKTSKNRRHRRHQQQQQEQPNKQRNVVKGDRTAQNSWKTKERNGNRKGRGKGRDSRNTTISFGRSGWSKPEQEYPQPQEDDDPTPTNGSSDEIRRWKTPNDIDEATERIATIVQDEVYDAVDNQDDLINTSLAATAAVTFVTSVLGGGDMDVTTTVKNDDAAIEQSKSNTSNKSNDKNSTEKIQEDFATFAKGNSMSALMEEFGQADPNWKTIVPDSDVVGIDTDNTTATNKTTGSNNRTDSSSKSSRYMLGTEGKAPIHIQIESFGFVHGAPSRSKRDSGWSPYTQPVGPIDVRHDIDPVPTYLMWHDGIHSAQVKRILMTSSSSKSESESQSQSQSSSRKQASNGFVQYIKSIASDQILPCLIEAQDVGGHGYVSPLSCKVQIGSELGRHRSVVCVERVAVALRQLLRENSESKIRQPISVGTFHRDIEKRPPNLKSTRGGGGGDNDDDYDDTDTDRRNSKQKQMNSRWE